MKTKLKISVILLLLLAALLFAAVLIAELTDIPIYESPVLIAALALLGLGTAASCFSKRWLTLKNCGFIICHAAVVIFLVSAFVWYVWGQMGIMTLYAGGNASRVIYESDGSGEPTGTVDLPFTIECTDFSVVYLPYEYDYSVVEGSEFVKKGTAQLAETGLDCGKYGVVPREEAVNADGSLITQFQHGDLLLTWNGQLPAVRQYSAEIAFSDGTQRTLSVNRPTTYNGWKIYLLSYSETLTEEGMYTVVNLQVKHDPAVNFAIAGLILCPIGTFLLCLRPRRPKREEAAEDEA